MGKRKREGTRAAVRKLQESGMSRFDARRMAYGPTREMSKGHLTRRGALVALRAERSRKRKAVGQEPQVMKAEGPPSEEQRDV